MAGGGSGNSLRRCLRSRFTHHFGEFGLSFEPVFVAITAFEREAGNVDKLFKKAGGEKDEKKRRTYYRKALELINENTVVLMLDHLPVDLANRRGLKNFKTNCRGDTCWAYGGASHSRFENGKDSKQAGR